MMKSQKGKISAGILAYRYGANGLEFFLAHMGGPFYKNKDEGFWHIPKGEVLDPAAQDLLPDALREFKEETDHEVMTDKFIALGTVVNPSGKMIHAWGCELDAQPPFKSNTFDIEWPPKSGEIQTFPEMDDWQYFAEEVARQKISTYQVPFIDRLIEALGNK